jgi:acetylornithine deacetylase/succinyl-diaminopimelate desuccinylase-like protein
MHEEVLRLATELCSIPGVTVPAAHTDFEALKRTVGVAKEYALGKGLRLYEREAGEGTPYPYLIVTFQENDLEDEQFVEAVALIGHLDVVPASAEGQFSPVLRGDDLYARGAADMKTVVATYLAWMGAMQERPGAKPPFILLLSCCEENGSEQPHHTLSVLRWLHEEMGVTVRFGVVGERTGELEWMGENLLVGPVCRENRSWRWIRAESGSARGLDALRRVADTVSICRTSIADANAKLGRQEQPGLRSGFLNPFTFVAADEGIGEGMWLTVAREKGASAHSAVADASPPSLVERFRAIAERVVEELGAENVRLAGVEIGQEGNFNTYDGSGEMRLVVTGALDACEESGLTIHVSNEQGTVRTGPTVVGIDIRELLDHREIVQGLLKSLPDMLWGEAGLEMVNDRPAWRCPEDQPDLVRLLAAYEAVVGEPSPDLVKLHGNDGGSLVAWQGENHAVVFGQVGGGPHGPEEFHRLTSIRPYWEILDIWAAAYCDSQAADFGDS